MKNKFIIPLCFLAIACSEPQDNAYTLFKTTKTDPTQRVIVNVFDIETNADKNGKTCFEAKQAFDAKAEPGVQYWCEKGNKKG